MMGLMKRLWQVAPVLAVATVLVGCGSDSNSTPKRTDSTIQTVSGGRDSLLIALAGVDGTTVLDLLKKEHDVEYRSTAVGAFVARVDKVKAGSTYFWIYSVNDSFPSVACDRYETSDGDRIVWHFRKMGR